MATSLVKNSLPRLCRVLAANHNSLAPVVTRSYASAWNKDWAPDPEIPKTDAQKAAAAKKYGLLPEDYKTWNESDIYSHGDYPNLPYAESETRDPYDDWDMPEYRRNYGEPLHVDADAVVADRWEPNKEYKYSVNTMALAFLGTIGFFTFMHLYYLDKPHFNPVLPKQFPADGKKHYTFEPVD